METDFFKEIEGLGGVDPELLPLFQKFQKVMTEEVIPGIVKSQRRQEELWLETRTWRIA